MLDALRRMKCAPLLPNLQSHISQRYLIHQSDILDFVACVAPPSLAELSLELDQYSAAYSRDIGEVQELRTLAPRFHSLQWVTFKIDPAAFQGDALAEVVRLWTTLRGVKFRLNPTSAAVTPVPVVNHQILRKLSKLPVLEELSFDARAALRSPRVWISGLGEAPSEDPTVFRALKRLQILTVDTPVAKRLLEAISSPALRELEVGASDLAALNMLPSDLRARPAVDSLTTLTLSGYSYTAGPNGIIPGSALYPLTHLHQLQCLSLNAYIHDCPSALAVGDADFAELTRAWPRLREFTIVDGYGPPVNRTVQTLVHLAKHCPSLWYATTTLGDNHECWAQLQKPATRADEGDAEVPASDSLPIHDHLTHLRLHHSSIDEAHLDVLARMLATMFPKLHRITRMVKNLPIVGGRSANIAMRLPYQEAVWKELLNLVRRYQISLPS